jgi:hypothetical protein
MSSPPGDLSSSSSVHSSPPYSQTEHSHVIYSHQMSAGEPRKIIKKPRKPKSVDEKVEKKLKVRRRKKEKEKESGKTKSFATPRRN